MKRIAPILLSAVTCLVLMLSASAQEPGGRDALRGTLQRDRSRTIRQPLMAPPVRDIERGLTSARTLEQKSDAAPLAKLQGSHQPNGDWHGSRCPSTTELRVLVDNFLATPHPDFPGLGSTVPGMSVSWSDRDCDAFTYAAGLRNVEKDKRLTPANLMSIGSMTKPIMAAITLNLNDAGIFGPQGLDTPVDQLLTREQVAALTVGDDPSRPKCPGFTYLWNRETGVHEWGAFACPDLSRVTLRHLMLSNHGMYDFLNEVLLPDGFFQYDEGAYFDFYQYLGLAPVPPVNSRSGFDYLKAFGLKQSLSASIGGDRNKDFEYSLGNTGFQLLGVILENRTGKSLDRLIQTLIVNPLRIDPIRMYLDPAGGHERGEEKSEGREEGHDENGQDGGAENQIADGYEIFTGNPLIETTGIYPLVNLHGHTAVNTRSFGLPTNLNLAGGAGGLIANPKSYRVFLDAFVNGRLLSPAAQREFDHSFIRISDFSSSSQVTVSNGFGLYEVKIRDIAGFPDVDYFQHGGAILGALCLNGVLRRPNSQFTVATGVMCQNTYYQGYPSQSGLFFRFVKAIMDAP